MYYDEDGAEYVPVLPYETAADRKRAASIFVIRTGATLVSLELTIGFAVLAWQYITAL